MSDEQDKKPRHPETFFLPPLRMFLTFLDKEQDEKKDANTETSENVTEKDVEKLIEKLSEKEE
jgi:hypothetical protein